MLDQENITLLEGRTSTLKATVTPEDASDTKVTWSSSDETKATVLGGVVTAVAAGTAIITVTTADGGYTAICTVTVTPVPVSIEVTNPPDKTVYKTGEGLNITGLVVKATFSGGEEREVEHSALDIDYGYFYFFDAGEKIIAVWYGDKHATFTVTVLALAKIKVTKSPDIVAVGEPFDVEALEVEATWGDDLTDKYIKERVEITHAHISDFYDYEAKMQTVTVTYEGKTATFDVLVLGVTELIIVSEPDKTLYKRGEELDIAGLVVRAIFSNSEEREVEHSGLDVSCFENWYDAGEKIINVYYGGKYARFIITLVVLTKIEVIKYPGFFVVYEPLKEEEIEVEATWGDDSTDKYIKERVTPTSIYDFDKFKAADQTITVSYESAGVRQTATFNVILRGIARITIETGPTKTVYKIGEYLNPDGLVIIATFNDETTERRTYNYLNIGISNFDRFTPGTQTLTVTYSEKTATFTVMVLTLAKIEITSSPTKTRYVTGESLNIAGLEVEATWGDDTTDKYIKEKVNITTANISGFNSSTAGTKTLTVTYDTGFDADSSKAATFTVTVLATVTFNPNGGAWGSETANRTVQVEPNTAVAEPEEPSRSRCIFSDWYTQAIGGTAYNFSTPVTGNITLYARWGFILPLTNTADVVPYLEMQTGTQTNPATLPMQIDLGNMTSSTSGWRQLLTALNTAGKYVDLDLSACTMSGTTFNPDTDVSTGKNRIVSIILPDTATSIPSRTSNSAAFRYFTALETASGKGITSVGNYAFRDCTSLENVSLPATETIGESAFLNCISLKSVSLPAVKIIGNGDSYFDGAFRNCTSLENISLPVAETIGSYAFQDCTSLESINLPVAKTIGDYAFYAVYGSTSLESINLPVAETIGESAFQNRTSLASVSLPVAKTIGNGAFQDCTSLKSVNLPLAETIGGSAFRDCTSLKSVSLPVATSIESIGAFWGCTSLESVSLPVAEVLGDAAFRGCTSLANVDIPSVKNLGSYTFHRTGTQALSIRMGSVAPYLLSDIFYEVTAGKNVTVRVPSGATGYGTSPWNTTDDNWGNAFRGRGMSSYFGYGTVNSYINLTIQYVTE